MGEPSEPSPLRVVSAPWRRRLGPGRRLGTVVNPQGVFADVFEGGDLGLRLRRDGGLIRSLRREEHGVRHARRQRPGLGTAVSETDESRERGQDEEQAG